MRNIYVSHFFYLNLRNVLGESEAFAYFIKNFDKSIKSTRFDEIQGSKAREKEASKRMMIDRAPKLTKKFANLVLLVII